MRLNHWHIQPLGTVLATAASLILGLQGIALAAAGTEGAAFLNIPVGAGPTAMGSAYTALATDAYAPVYNPAGLAFTPDLQLAGQHVSYLESMKYEHVSAIYKHFGFSMQYLGSGDINRTDVDASNNLVETGGDYSIYYAAYNLSYGRKFGEKLGIGLTGKMIQAKIDDVSASAFAMDLGALHKTNEKLSLGAALTNMGSQLKFISEGDDLPMAFKAGAAYKALRNLTVTGEGVYRKSGLASAHFGTEWHPLSMIALRLGYRTDTLEGLGALAGLTTGIGIQMWGQELAYAWSPYGDLGNAQYLSLLMKFGANEEEKRNLIQYRKIKKHQTVKKGPSKSSSKDDLEPEYQQLMQLLSSDEDEKTAQKR